VSPNGVENLEITLYVPDATAEQFRAEPGLERLLAEGTTEWAFLLPGWWERSHTVRLGMLRTRNSWHPMPEPGREAE
jgi:hypothetical protein